jgi:CRP-like cAMP-binding protein
VKDQYKKESFVKDLVPGSVFGEVALLYDTKRTASIRCKSMCTVAALTADHFEELIRTFPEIETQLKRKAAFYDDYWKLY